MNAITKLLNYILSSINNNESVLLVMLDISKAYDTCIDYIWHFWKSLKTQELGGNKLQWFETYLRSRGQKVDINGTFLDLDIRDGSCSRIKSKLFTVFFKLGETTRKIERIKEMDSVRYLGIWLDTKLNFNDYFNKIYRRLTFWLYDMKKFKTFYTLKPWNCFITPFPL